MTRGILIKTLRDLRGGLIGWGIALALTGALLIAVYPTFADMPGLQAMIDNSPAELRVLYGRFADMTTLEGFLAVEGFNMFLPALFLVYGILTGAALIGGEEERGTLDLVLAYPIPRWHLVAAKFAILTVATVILAAATAVGLVAGGLAVGLEANYGRIIAGTLNLVPLTLLFAAAAFLVTCAGWGRGPAAGLVGALATGAYLIDALAPLSPGLEAPSRYLPFYLYGGGMPLRDGIDPRHVIALLAAAAVLAGISAWAFQRRDIGV